VVRRKKSPNPKKRFDKQDGFWYNQPIKERETKQQEGLKFFAMLG